MSCLDNNYVYPFNSTVMPSVGLCVDPYSLKARWHMLLPMDSNQEDLQFCLSIILFLEYHL